MMKSEHDLAANRGSNLFEVVILWPYLYNQYGGSTQVKKEGFTGLPMQPGQQELLCYLWSPVSQYKKRNPPISSITTLTSVDMHPI